MSRETFLARVRAAAAAGRAYRVTNAARLRQAPPYAGAGEDKLARMAAEVTAAGGKSHLVETLADARATLAGLLVQYRATSALCWQHPLLERLGLAELLTSKGIARHDYASLSALTQSEQRERMLAADIGISSATWAVAETGSLAMASAPGRERSASLLPPVHLAVVEAEQVLPDLFDLFAEVEKVATATQESSDLTRPSSRAQAEGSVTSTLPTNLTLITGPSKTGDLELKLTTGVHGPGNWHVIIIRNGG